MNKYIMDRLSESLPFWSKISSEHQSYIIDNSRTVHFTAGQNIYSADSECLGVMIIIQGDLRIYMLSEEGKDITLYTLTANDVCIMSGSCVLRNITFDVFIDAVCDSDLIIINAHAFERLQSEVLLIENFALKTAVSRFSDVMWSMEQLLFYRFDKRLALFLIDESNKINSNIIKLTHAQIAQYISSAREVVSRTLKKFEKLSLLKLFSGYIEILSKSKLMELCK